MPSWKTYLTGLPTEQDAHAKNTLPKTHWTDMNTHCINGRAQALIEESDPTYRSRSTLESTCRQKYSHQFHRSKVIPSKLFCCLQCIEHPNWYILFSASFRAVHKHVGKKPWRLYRQTSHKPSKRQTSQTFSPPKPQSPSNFHITHYTFNTTPHHITALMASYQKFVKGDRCLVAQDDDREPQPGFYANTDIETPPINPQSPSTWPTSEDFEISV